MQLGTDTIDYQLYSDAARTQVWGDTAGTTAGGTGTERCGPVHPGIRPCAGLGTQAGGQLPGYDYCDGDFLVKSGYHRGFL
ncbi:spore coat protein U domain-containing protein [Microbulbifer sp. TB1203]|uniref:spore coat protein U domain-containing protein n=1 Tax=unclassified Microbulbifer TaxID=2619833 RepID=UPI0035B43CC0